MHVLFIHGPPAVGKLTVANEVSRQTGLPVFHNHLAVDVALSLFAFGSDGFTRVREAIWLAAFEAAARADRSFIFTFCPEPTVSAELLRRMHAAVEDAGGTVIYCALDAATDVLAGRVGNDDRRQYGKLTDPTLFRSLAASGGFAGAALPEPSLRIDTGRHSAAEAAAAIAQLVIGAAGAVRGRTASPGSP